MAAETQTKRSPCASNQRFGDIKLTGISKSKCLPFQVLQIYKEDDVCDRPISKEIFIGKFSFLSKILIVIRDLDTNHLFP